MDNFYPYNVFLATATNIPQRLKTAFCGPGSHTVYIYIARRIVSYIVLGFP